MGESQLQTAAKKLTDDHIRQVIHHTALQLGKTWSAVRNAYTGASPSKPIEKALLKNMKLPRKKLTTKKANNQSGEKIKKENYAWTDCKCPQCGKLYQRYLFYNGRIRPAPYRCTQCWLKMDLIDPHTEEETVHNNRQHKLPSKVFAHLRGYGQFLIRGQGGLT